MPVNRVPLTPLSLLQRTAEVFPTRTAVVYGERRTSYADYYGRVNRLASALRAAGVGTDDKVAILAPNVPMVLEAHYGIPLAGGVIVAINTRLSSGEVAYILEHSESRVLLVDRGLLHVVRPILAQVPGLERVVVGEDPAAGDDDGWRPPGSVSYEAFLENGSPAPLPVPVQDEWETIAIDYTSGTTGRPKGVMYSHRGAYLNTISVIMQSELTRHSVYLWTLPMFHCNGWCFTWGLPAIGATSVCLRAVEPALMRRLIQEEGVTHFCGAPIVLQTLASLPDAERFRFKVPVRASTGGAPPSPTLLQTMTRMNVQVTHLYGLTETIGPNTLCEVQDAWLELDAAAYAKQISRQGVVYLMDGETRVLDEQHRPVPADGVAMGEICMRGNTVMQGYYKDPAATAQAFRNDWFHSGDLAVLHPDGYIEVRDRAKDIIMSGGENIST
ncbi:MAG: AMP-binding protein, partial [Candidatus Lambdaproteobacteria bacterium]|nr:AMP-binding protein [Candidatus Lambdaproteobacteria bacterium]